MTKIQEIDKIKNTHKNKLKNKIMATINPHINFNGNAEEAFNFYKSVFGGEFTKIICFKNLANPEFSVSEKEEKLIKMLNTNSYIPHFLSIINLKRTAPAITKLIFNLFTYK